MKRRSARALSIATLSVVLSVSVFVAEAAGGLGGEFSWSASGDQTGAYFGAAVSGASAESGPFEVLTAAPVARPPWTFRESNLAASVTRWYKVLAETSDSRACPDPPSPAHATSQAGAVTPITDLFVERAGDDLLLTWSGLSSDPPLDRVEVFRDTAPLVGSEVDQGLHHHADATVAETFTEAGAAASADPALFYDLRPVDQAEERAAW